MQHGTNCADGSHPGAFACCSYKPCNIFCCNCDDYCRGGVVYKNSLSFKMDFFKNGLALIWAALIADTWNESEKCTSSVQWKNNGLMAYVIFYGQI